MSLSRLGSVLLAIVLAPALYAKDIKAVWLGQQDESAAAQRFAQLWQEQRGQPLELITQRFDANNPLQIPAQTWFVLSADDVTDQALLDQGFHDIIVSLRAERARVMSDIKRSQHAHWVGVYADPSPQQLLSLAAAAFPAVPRIGVIFDRRYVHTKSLWYDGSTHYQRQLQGLFLHEGENAQRLLPLLLNRADIVVLPAHHEQYDQRSIDHVVASALQHGKMVIAGGEIAQHSGALLTVLPDPETRLKQAVLLCGRALRGETQVFESAKQQQLFINHQVRRTLNVNIDTKRIMAQVDFPLTLTQEENE
jgi:hypothetical protein